MFEHFDHTADLGLRIRAASLEELLADAARGLLAMHVANPEAVRPLLSRTVNVNADDPALLLFDWLSELLYFFESERLLVSECDISLRRDVTSTTGTEIAFQLTANCRGEPMDAARHQMDHEVKAITYHGLNVAQEPSGDWFAEVIVDI